MMVHQSMTSVDRLMCCISLSDVLQKVVYTFAPIGLALGALGLAWMVLVP